MAGHRLPHRKIYVEFSAFRPLRLIDRLRRYYGCGAWAGKLFCLLMALDFLLLWLLEICFPWEGIDKARDWPKKEKKWKEGGQDVQVNRERDAELMVVTGKEGKLKGVEYVNGIGMEWNQCEL